MTVPRSGAWANPHALLDCGVVLVDVALDARGQLSPLARMADHLVLVMQPSAASVTAAYAGLKRLQYAHALQRFQFLLNEVPNERRAKLVISNVQDASRRYLAVRLECLGWIGSDALVRQARRLNRTVCEAYTGSAAAHEFRRIAAAIAPGHAPAAAATAPAPIRAAGVRARAAA